MPSEEKMSVDERRKYMKLIAPRYLKAQPTKVLLYVTGYKSIPIINIFMQ
jgi:hypothetical protein